MDPLTCDCSACGFSAEGWSTIRKGIGWAIGFIGFGTGFALTYWRP